MKICLGSAIGSTIGFAIGSCNRRVLYTHAGRAHTDWEESPAADE